LQKAVKRLIGGHLVLSGKGVVEKKPTNFSFFFFKTNKSLCLFLLFVKEKVKWPVASRYRCFCSNRKRGEKQGLWV